MDPSATAIVAAVAANAVVLLGSFALWLAHRTRRAERLEQRERERAQLYLGPVEARLAELARAVDAIAGRMSSGYGRTLGARDSSSAWSNT
jgi:hypothetical protein